MTNMGAEFAVGLQERRETESRELNVTVLYQNEQTRGWAEKVFSTILARQGAQPLRSTWWNLDDLAQPAVLAGAVSTAIRADVVIVSVASGGGLPLPFYIWAEGWLPNRLVLGGELVALIATHGEEAYCRNYLIRDYLREAAKNAGLNFRLEERTTPAHSGQPRRTVAPICRARPTAHIRAAAIAA